MVKYSVYDVREALDFFDQKRYQEALELFLKIYEDSKFEMNESSSLVYYIAISMDALGKHFEAAEWINKAKELDSFNYYTEQAAQYIFQNIENIFVEQIKKSEHPQAIVDIYQLLLASGRVSSFAQFHMVRFLVKTKNYTEAKPILENALARNPHDQELLKLRRQIAELEGDLDTLKKLGDQ